MKILDKYLELEKQIHEYFGYKEDWKVIPIDDAREYFWRFDGDNVHFADTEEELESEDGNYYANELYRQRFLPKWFYEGEEYTMICVDTHVDGNKFLQIFDNSKRRED